jgi:hypothetical protein
MPHQVFISYAGEDAIRAQRVCDSLEAAGVRCWMAPRDIPAGVSYADEIIRAIDASRLLIVLYSRHSAESRHVRSELQRAFNNNAPILPVRLDEHELPADLQYFLSTAQWMNAFDSDFESELAEIVRSVKSLLDAQGLEPVTDGARPGASPRWGAAALLFLVIAGAVILMRPDAATDRSVTPDDLRPLLQPLLRRGRRERSR